MPILWSLEYENLIRKTAYAEGQEAERREWIFRWKMFVGNIRFHIGLYDNDWEYINADNMAATLTKYIKTIKDKNLRLENDLSRLNPTQVPYLQEQISSLQSELAQAREQIACLKSQVQEEQISSKNLEVLLKAEENQTATLSENVLALQNRLDIQGKKSGAKGG